MCVLCEILWPIYRDETQLLQRLLSIPNTSMRLSVCLSNLLSLRWTRCQRTNTISAAMTSHSVRICTRVKQIETQLETTEPQRTVMFVSFPVKEKKVTHWPTHLKDLHLLQAKHKYCLQYVAQVWSCLHRFNLLIVAQLCEFREHFRIADLTNHIKFPDTFFKWKCRPNILLHDYYYVVTT